MNTIHTSSLTHEIESYGSRQDLLQFIQNRYEELVPGGVWINRDVVGPYSKEQEVLLLLNNEDGIHTTHPYEQFGERQELSHYLGSLSTYSRFLRFARDFRATEGYQLQFKEITFSGKNYIQLQLSDAAEFLSRKDYTDNWQSEMHETFCFWDFEDWKQQLMLAGFSIHPASKAYTNEWIVSNRLKGKAELFILQEGQPKKFDYPVSHMLLIGVKQ